MLNEKTPDKGNKKDEVVTAELIGEFIRKSDDELVEIFTKGVFPERSKKGGESQGESKITPSK